MLTLQEKECLRQVGPRGLFSYNSSRHTSELTDNTSCVPSEEYELATMS